MKKYNVLTMRHGWTVIEFIFIIIIIGILAAVAIPKLSATRDDARLATDVRKMAICIKDASSKYVATDTHLAAGDSKACDVVKCYNITYATNIVNFIVSTDSSAANYCANIDSIGAHLAGTYEFEATNIIY